jgi:hypothetical protein
MVHVRDTTPDAAAVQTAIYRRMTTDQRTWAAAEMSAMARAITLENIRARHPEYDAHQARMALYRLLVGDELFRRAWPAAARAMIHDAPGGLLRTIVAALETARIRTWSWDRSRARRTENREPRAISIWS